MYNTNRSKKAICFKAAAKNTLLNLIIFQIKKSLLSLPKQYILNFVKICHVKKTSGVFPLKFLWQHNFNIFVSTQH